jgi:endonuclease YncB( thermonuclease family)
MLLDRKYLPTALVLACLFICPHVQATSFTGPVVSVLDGDTIEVLHNNHAERIRLSSIDCPEKAKPTASERSRPPPS